MHLFRSCMVTLEVEKWLIPLKCLQLQFGSFTCNQTRHDSQHTIQCKTCAVYKFSYTVSESSHVSIGAAFHRNMKQLLYTFTF